MKSIYIVVPSLVRHGMEKMAVLAAESLREQYSVKLIVFFDEKESYKTDADLVCLNVPVSESSIGKITNMFIRAKKLRKMRRQDNVAAVISFGTSANFVNVFSRGKGKTIISFRGFATVKKDFSTWVSCKLADKVFCISKDLTNHLNSIFPWVKGKSHVVYNSIDVEAINKKAAEDVDFHPAKPAFVAIGRLEPVKGYYHLLKAFSIYCKKEKNASLTFIGDGSIAQELKDKAREFGIAERVTFLGNQSNPYKYIKKCDVCIQTSITEGFMNVIVESFACGIPAVSTNCRSGPAEILNGDYEDRQNTQKCEYGILVPAFTSNDSIEDQKEQALADAMEIMVEDYLSREDISMLVKERASFFSVDKYKEALSRLVEE